MLNCFSPTLIGVHVSVAFHLYYYGENRIKTGCLRVCKISIRAVLSALLICVSGYVKYILKQIMSMTWSTNCVYRDWWSLLDVDMLTCYALIF